MASSSVAQLTMDSFNTYLDAVVAFAPKQLPTPLVDETLSEQDRQQPPTHEQVYHWRELAGAMTLRGAAGMTDESWPAELAPSQITLNALVERHLIVRRGRAWHLRRNWYLRLQAFRQIAVEAPPLTLLERPAPNLPTYAELKDFETICCYLDALPKSRCRLPFMGLSVGTEGEVPITTLKLMRRYHLVQHTSTCEWKLSPRWQHLLKELWRGVQAALRDRGVPQQMAPVPRSLVAGIDTWHLNWLVEHPLPASLRERLDRWQDQAREEETELETELVYDGAPLVMYRWGTKAERGKELAGVSWSYVLLNPSLRLLIRRSPLGGIVAQARLGSECLWRRTPKAALDELTLLMKRLWHGQQGRWQVSQVHLCHDVANVPLTMELLSRFVSRSRQRAIYDAAQADVQRVRQASYGDDAENMLAATIDWDAEFADVDPLSGFGSFGDDELFGDRFAGAGWEIGASAPSTRSGGDEAPVEERSSSVYGYGRRLSGLTFSPGGALSVAIYLKRFESILHHKVHMFPLWKAAGWNQQDEITRVEPRLRRDALRELRVPGNEGANLDDPFVMLEHLEAIFALVVRGVEECPDAVNTAWLRLVIPREGESNRSRWDTDPSWRVVQAASFQTVPAPARRIIRRKQRAHNVEQLARGSYGYLVSLICEQCPDGEHWDVSRGIRELAEHLTSEAGKPGKDFGELVRHRRKERGFPVDPRDEVLPTGQREVTSVLTSEADTSPASWDDDEHRERRPQLRKRAAEQRLHEAFTRLEAADWRQEPERRLVWYEAQYTHELATYAQVCAGCVATAPSQ